MWRKRGFDLDFGIGIAQGYATIGAIGFEGRWDYTAIGTVTNLANRCPRFQAHCETGQDRCPRSTTRRNHIVGARRAGNSDAVASVGVGIRVAAFGSTPAVFAITAKRKKQHHQQEVAKGGTYYAGGKTRSDSRY